jgi:hypothetical protein
MCGASRRHVLSGLLAGIGLAVTREMQPQPASAARSKPVKFDISGSQFAEDCRLAGGEFVDWGGGEYTCYFNGWRMDCSKVTGRCRITCDPGVKCVSSKRLPRNVAAALNKAAAQIPADAGKTSNDHGDPGPSFHPPAAVNDGDPLLNSAG